MGYQIKGWTKFQHYQSGKRNPDWIKLYRGLLDDIDWHLLDPKAAKALVMLWLLASETGGELPPLPKIAFRLRLSEKETKSILSQLDHWVEQDASDVLAERYQSDSLEEEENKNKKERESGASAPSRAHQIPKDWSPIENHFSQAERLGFGARQVEDMAEDMRIWAGANGSLKKDWDLTFSGWMRREFKSGHKSGHGPPKNGAGVKAPLAFRSEITEIVKPPTAEREAQVQSLVRRSLKHMPKVHRSSA
jgi:hypothetical protein